ncbi:MAG: TnsA endonuclease N-terminal domain-containing protein [Candidatus Thiodiazotropha endolucinida]
MKKVYQPARRVITRRAVIQNGRFASRKMGRAIDFESPVERDFLFLAEYDRQVVGIWEQPLKVAVELGGKWRNKYPDFKLLMRNGEIRIHEVKPKKEAEKLENQAAFEALENLFMEVGVDYRVTVDTDIRKEPRLQNIKNLARYAVRMPSQMDLLWLRQLLGEVAVITVGDLAEGKFGRMLTKPTVYGLIFRGELDIDINLPLTNDTLLFKGDFPTQRYTGAEPEVALCD